MSLLIDVRIRYLLARKQSAEAKMAAERYTAWAEEQPKDDRGHHRYNAACLYATAAGESQNEEMVNKAVDLLMDLQKEGYFIPIYRDHFRKDPDFEHLRTHPKIQAFDRSLGNKTTVWGRDHLHFQWHPFEYIEAGMG